LKLLLQQLMLTCCIIYGWSLNIPWTLYVSQMVPMLNVCQFQNKLWRVSLADDAQCVCVVSYSFNSWIKVKILFIHALRNKPNR
jgi:hypothetical protein